MYTNLSRINRFCSKYLKAVMQNGDSVFRFNHYLNIKRILTGFSRKLICLWIDSNKYLSQV